MCSFIVSYVCYSESGDRGIAASHCDSSSVQSKVVRSAGDGSGQPGAVKKKSKQVVALNVDIIGDEFWAKHPKILT